MSRQASILLVEDNLELNEANRRVLEDEGYSVRAALTLKQAQQALAEGDPDVILLDVMLPDGNGIQFCQEIRPHTSAHILFLTSKTAHEELLLGLDSGGDDYITKPYRLDELLARVNAVVRRRKISAAPVRMTLGLMQLDVPSMRAEWDGCDLLLSPREFALLAKLMRDPNSPVTREELYKAAWNQPMEGDAGALWQAVSRLNRKLCGCAEVRYERGAGYALRIQS